MRENQKTAQRASIIKYFGRKTFPKLLESCSSHPALATLSSHGGIKVMLGEIEGTKVIIGLDGMLTGQRYVLISKMGSQPLLISLLFPDAMHYDLAKLALGSESAFFNANIWGGFVTMNFNSREISAHGKSTHFRKENNSRAEELITALANAIGFERLEKFVKEGK